MSLFILKTRGLTWQDRTINVECMMAPTRSTLLYNKHKSMSTKHEQNYSNLERERLYYLQSFKSEKRMMERRRENYERNKTDIASRLSSADSRRHSVSPTSKTPEPERQSAPPRLQASSTQRPNSAAIFMTQLRRGHTKSADTGKPEQTVGKKSQQHAVSVRLNTTEHASKPSTAPSGTVGTKSRGTPMPAMATAGHPHLSRIMPRQKSVRFEHGTGDVKNTLETANSDQVLEKQLPIEERIQKFIKSQQEFNKRHPCLKAIGRKRGSLARSSPTDLLPKRSNIMFGETMSLEEAFDAFMADRSSENFQKLVKFTSKMRNTYKSSSGRNSILPGATAIDSRYRNSIPPKTAW